SLPGRTNRVPATSARPGTILDLAVSVERDPWLIMETTGKRRPASVFIGANLWSSESPRDRSCRPPRPSMSLPSRRQRFDYLSRNLFARRPLLAYVAVGLGIIAATVLILFAMGQPLSCRCGMVKLWQGDVMSAENSQQLADWYSPSHVIHGLLLYGLLWLIARHRPLGLRALIALVIESGWEIIENSPIIIDRYREATISLGYRGDSVINSVSDIVFMLVGFALAARLPVAASIALAVLLELAVGTLVRANLTLTIIMLVWPLETIRTWQAGG